MVNLYVLMVENINDRYCVVYEGKPSVTDVLNGMSIEISDLERGDYENIKKMVSNDVDEVTSNTIDIMDYDATLTLQRVTELYKGNKNMVEIKFVKDKLASKTTLKEIMDSQFFNLKIDRNSDDSIYEYVGLFVNKDGEKSYLEFNCDENILELKEEEKQAYFLECCGFKYLGFSKASVDIIDIDTGDLLDIILKYNA